VVWMFHQSHDNSMRRTNMSWHWKKRPASPGLATRYHESACATCFHHQAWSWTAFVSPAVRVTRTARRSWRSRKDGSVQAPNSAECQAKTR
jgi:hypothetical protein